MIHCALLFNFALKHKNQLHYSNQESQTIQIKLKQGAKQVALQSKAPLLKAKPNKQSIKRKILKKQMIMQKGHSLASRKNQNEKGAKTAISQYVSYIRSVVDQNKYYPILAKKRRIQGVVTVQLLLNNYGKILEKKLSLPSGHPLLDKATLESIAKLKTLRPFPKEIALKTLLVSIPIAYKLY